MTNEEKLRGELENIIDDWRYGAKITSSLAIRIHELYKEATYLKGNEELPLECVKCGKYRQFTTGLYKLLKSFKSTEDWKK